MILIFAGAGASYAVNEDNYPTTEKFFDLLGTNITGMKDFQVCIKYLSHDKGKDNHDIEEVLFYIKSLKGSINALTNPDFIIGNHLRIHDNNLAQNIENQYVVPNKANITELETRIYREVFNHYYKEPSRTELGNNWLTLIEHIRHKNQIEFFTTNYDIVLEKLLMEYRKHNISIFPDVSKEYHKTIDINNWSKALKDSSYFRLTKLHGSVDWTSFEEVGM